MGRTHKEWVPGDIVKIQAPTGIGKTTYVLSTLREEALQQNKNILYLHNRRLLGQQMKAILGQEIGWDSNMDELNEIQCFDGIRICSYQGLQTMLIKGAEILLADYAYIVLDEVHYILRDALFQPQIAFFLKWLQKKTESAKVVWIFVSATLDRTWEFLCSQILALYEVSVAYEACCQRWPGSRVYQARNPYRAYNLRSRHLWEYEIEANYSQVDTFYYQELANLIPWICDGTSGKWLIFVSNKQRGKTLADNLAGILGKKMCGIWIRV